MPPPSVNGNPYDPGTSEYNNFNAQQQRMAELEMRIKDQELARDRRPDTPTWQALTGEGGDLKDLYKIKAAEELTPQVMEQLAGINLNTQALDALRSQALSTETNPWTQLQLTAQGLEEQGARDKAQADATGANQSAWSQLAMRGGLSGGERERIATQGARHLNDTSQNVAMEGRKARTGILSDAEKNRLDILKALPGMEVQALNPAFQKAEYFAKAKDQDIARTVEADKFNVGNLINERNAKGQFDMGNYAEAMKAWGAEKQAQATQNSGGGK